MCKICHQGSTHCLKPHFHSLSVTSYAFFFLILLFSLPNLLCTDESVQLQSLQSLLQCLPLIPFLRAEGCVSNCRALAPDCMLMNDMSMVLWLSWQHSNRSCACGSHFGIRRAFWSPRSTSQCVCSYPFHTEQDCSFNDFLYLCGDSITKLTAFPSGFWSFLEFFGRSQCPNFFWCRSVTFHFIATSTPAALG